MLARRWHSTCRGTCWAFIVKAQIQCLYFSPAPLVFAVQQLTRFLSSHLERVSSICTTTGLSIAMSKAITSSWRLMGESSWLTLVPCFRNSSSFRGKKFVGERTIKISFEVALSGWGAVHCCACSLEWCVSSTHMLFTESTFAWSIRLFLFFVFLGGVGGVSIIRWKTHLFVVFCCV